MQATVISVERDTHTVRFVYGDEIPRGDHHIEWHGSGDVSASRSSRTPILGETGYINLSWSVEVTREHPPVDDPYPLDMPNTIANLTFYGREDRTDGLNPDPPLEYTYMDHLYVQEPARGQGYGQLLWDAYLTTSVAIGGDARGKVGDEAHTPTVSYLTSNGVPREDIESREGGGWLGSRTAIWDTPVENIERVAPLTTTTQEVDG